MAVVFGGTQLSALGVELSPRSSAPEEASVAGIRTSSSVQSSVVPTATAVRTATPSSTPTATVEAATATATTEPEEPLALAEEETATPEPEPTDTPEPTATPEPTETPTPLPTATAVPPTATPTLSVAVGVPVTPAGGNKTAGATPTPASTPAVTPLPFTGTLTGAATPYWDGLAGNSMGCTGAGVYDPNNTSTAAIGPAYYDSIPCGTALKVCGPVGCIDVVRTDSCPGCTQGHVIDLSRAGFNLVCGPTASQCNVTITKR